ncbi:hypothetical protein [Sulfurimonas sp.]|uniref:hypothetical protein n=1 Tax=Sulfurimonas sp. TaxID=2022749 RepID=UPI0025FE3798|nr:hypothetical protein [Sulfurimonas sp.]
MSKRVDIKNQIFNDIYVLEFDKNKNTQASWKCLCMCCNKVILVTYSNLKNGNTKSCASCGQKISNGLEQDILCDIKKGDKIAHIVKKHKVGRSVVYRIKKKFESV